jgi:hypothetical protein
MIDIVSETTHEPWSEIWKMGIYEFFNIYNFAQQRFERRKREMEKWRRKH